MPSWPTIATTTDFPKLHEVAFRIGEEFLSTVNKCNGVE